MTKIKNDEELKKENPELYHIAREKGTETPFTGKYVHTKEDGTYNCAVCGQPLFGSDTKFDSGTGWPSFYDAIPGSVKMQEDAGHGMVRTEITCSNCGAHLGHMFGDAPQTPTGTRLCINSCSIDLNKTN